MPCSQSQRIFQAVLNAVLVCHHRRTTFPVTPGREAAALPRTYIVCLDCGAELPFDWKRMAVMPSENPAAESAHPERRESTPDRASSLDTAKASGQPPIRPAASAAVPPEAALPAAEAHALGGAALVLPSAAVRTGNHPHAASASSQYVARAKLRMQQVHVALRVLNALMTGLSVQPDDVAKLRSWADPGHQACSPRDLAQRVVACAVSP